MPFPQSDQIFDAFTSGYSIYCVDEIRVLIRECKRLLENGGGGFIVGHAWDHSRESYDLNRDCPLLYEVTLVAIRSKSGGNV